MTTFSIQNFGCRATDADAASLRQQLLATGLAVVDEHSGADIVVLNTCTVTASADAEARETVRKVHRANPLARIVVTGCYAQRAPEEIAELPGVTLVVGNSHMREIPRLVSDPASHDAQQSIRAADFVSLAQIADPFSLVRGPAKILTSDIFAQETISAMPAATLHAGRTRPILKIQDGCNNRCSYCVIPFVRGRNRSLPPEAVIHETRRLLSAGAKEIVLSGINLGSYGRDLHPRADLAALVQKILSETELERLRFSSIEPQDVTSGFIDLVASSSRIAPHFHIPMQSGSNRILKAMHRWYLAEHYAERINLIHKALPNAGIGADVIAGFPDETDEDFAATLRLVDVLPFTYLHVFSFSARPETQAGNLSSPVPGPVIRERARILRAAAAAKSSMFRASQESRRERGLTLERRGVDWTECLTGNYLAVRVAGVRPANQWVDLQLAQSADQIATEICAAA